MTFAPSASDTASDALSFPGLPTSTRRQGEPQALLISFCNLSAPGPALGVYDFATGEFGWVPPPSGMAPWVGLDGICRRDDGHWLLPQLAWGGISGLMRLDSDLRITFHVQLGCVRDAHSLVPFKDGFLVTDTQHNRLVFLRPDVARQTISEEVFWTYSSESHDVAHVNSVARLGGDIFVSIFGAKPPDGWAGADDGQIIHVPSGAILCRGLAHPHSLIALGDSLYWLESARGIMHRFRPADGQRETIALGGFLRGLTCDGAYLYLGVSALRRRSRSSGVPNARVASSSQQAQSWICRLNLDGTGLKRRRLTEFGTEIYDLAVVDRKTAREYLDRTAELAAVERVWSYEDEIARLNAELARAVEQMANSAAPGD